MGDVPGWLREQLQIEGWVVVESLETFDVHSGDRYADRAIALRKALAGDALLASSGQATLSRDVEDAFFIGRLWRSSKPLPSGERVTLVHSLDSVERHAAARAGLHRHEALHEARTHHRGDERDRFGAGPTGKRGGDVALRREQGVVARDARAG